MEASKLVRHIQRFINLNDNEKDIIEKHTQRLSIKQFSFLLQKGEINSSIYFVEKGCLRMFFEKTKSVELTTQFAIEDWWLTDFYSYINNSPSSYFTQALEQSEIISIDKTKYQELLKEIPQLNNYFEAMMQRNIAASQLRIKYLFEMSHKEILEHFTTSFPDFVHRVPLKMVYSYLGISHNGKKLIS